MIQERRWFIIIINMSLSVSVMCGVVWECNWVNLWVEGILYAHPRVAESYFLLQILVLLEYLLLFCVLVLYVTVSNSVVSEQNVGFIDLPDIFFTLFSNIQKVKHRRFKNISNTYIIEKKFSLWWCFFEAKMN